MEIGSPVSQKLQGMFFVHIVSQKEPLKFKSETTDVFDYLKLALEKRDKLAKVGDEVACSLIKL